MPRHTDDEDLKAARGTLRSDRNKPVEFTPLTERRFAPDELIDDDRAKTEYRRITRRMIEDGQAAEVDESLLIAYCLQISRHFKMLAAIEKMELDGKKVTKVDYDAADKALKNAMNLGSMFGLTPAGRSKIKPGKAKVKKTGETTEDGFNEIMKAS